MPGEHVDKVFNEANARIGYEPLKPEVYNQATKEEQALDTARKKSSVGKDVFDEIEKNQTLTPEERQEVYQRLAKASTQRELDSTSEGQKNTLMRTATRNTNFMTAYLDKYAKGYNEAVLNEIRTETLKLQVPTDPGLAKRYPNVGENPTQAPEVRPETLTQLDSLSEQLGVKIVQAQTNNLHKLSPEARKFLQASMEPTLAEGTEVTNVALSSTLVLKNTSPMITTLGREIGQDPSLKVHGKLLEQSNKLSQTFYNNTQQQPGAKLSTDKTQNKVAEKLLTQELLSETAQSFEALSEGGQKLTNLTTALGKKEETAKTLAAKQEMDRKLAPFDNQVKALEQKRDQLKNNPTTGDKIKAFFKHGLKGVDGEIAKLDTKIEATKIAKSDIEKGVSVEERQGVVNRLKHNQAVVSHEMDRAAGVVTLDNASKSLNMKPVHTEKEVNQAISHHQALDPAKKELAASIKTQERVLSVREKLGPKPETKVDAPKQGAKIH